MTTCKSMKKRQAEISAAVSYHLEAGGRQNTALRFRIAGRGAPPP